MDRQELMKRRSMAAALAVALAVSGMKIPAAAVSALTAGQILFYGWAWATAPRQQMAWACGKRYASETRRWMNAVLCGACCGSGVWLVVYALFHARFHCQAPMMTALIAGFAARASTLRLFARWTPNIRMPIVGSVAALACVSVCLYPLF